MILNNILISSTLLFALGLSIQTVRISNKAYELEISKIKVAQLKNVVSIYEVDQEILNGVVERMTKSYNKIKIDCAARLRAAENRDPLIVIRYVDKFITPDVNMTRGDCNDI